QLEFLINQFSNPLKKHWGNFNFARQQNLSSPNVPNSLLHPGDLFSKASPRDMCPPEIDTIFSIAERILFVHKMILNSLFRRLISLTPSADGLGEFYSQAVSFLLFPLFSN